ncbi:MAG: glycosyl transferase family 2 [Thermosediminibacteraceae bacterium]|nr:glycosyl transferase family 2 [Thermosediminibacteraceae bacterium]
MNLAVVPARNEEGRIGSVLNMLSETSVDRILVILNGCTDGTLDEIKSNKFPHVDLLIFKEPLGYDIPRAVGVFYALKNGADCVTFVDGDMTGNLVPVVNSLVESILSRKVDLALTLCQTDNLENKLAQELYFFRKLLNTRLGIFNKIGAAIPSHGPCAVSRKLMTLADIKDFAVPPVILAFTVKNNLSVEAPVSIPSRKLGSKERGFCHAKKIADTIIGDIIEAINYFEGKPRIRTINHKEYQGFNPFRRFDLLEKFISLYSKNPNLNVFT